MGDKPKAVPVNASGIPDALKQMRRWMLWRYDWQQHDSGKSGRWTKPPYTPDGYRARHNQTAAYRTFQEVIDAYTRGGFDGLGFALGDGWAGIDLDKCLHDGNVVELNAQPFVERLAALNAYREVSPSGTGLKVIGRAERIGGEINFASGKDTPFDRARFFAVTGAGSIGDVTVDLTAVLHEWFPQAVSAFGAIPSFVNPNDARGQCFDTVPQAFPKLNDQGVVSTIMTSAQAVKFRKLAAGDMSDYGDDHSCADQALVNILAYWTQHDAEQIDRLFRKSGLMRDKWLSRSYCHATLVKAGVAEDVVCDFLRRR